MRQKIHETVRLGTDNENRNAPTDEILLVLDTFVHREEKVKARAFGQREQVSVLLAGQTRFRHGLALMVRQRVLELARDTLVKQNSHPNWPTTSDFPSSSAAMAASLVTVGKSSRNSSR